MQQALTDEDKLMKAVSNQDVEGIRRLANPDNIHKIYYNPNTKLGGYTLLEHAACHDSVDSIKTLLAKGADVNFKNQGSTALHIATSNYSENFTSVEALLKGGADVNSPDGAGRAPLHLAISNGHHKSVNLLLEAKADIHLRDNAGNTPLHYAAESANIDAARLLKDKGAIFDVTNNAGKKPLALAKLSQGGLVDFLIDNTTPYIIPPADKEVVLSTAEFIKIVLSNDAPDKKADAIKTLLETGADPNIRLEIPQNKSSILQYFVYDENSKAVEHLLEKGAKVNEVDQDGDTALHILAQKRTPHSEAKIAVLELLLGKEANADIRNTEGKTPIDCAVENGQKEIADAMRKSLRGQKEIADATRETLPQINFFPWSDEMNNEIVAKANADLIKVTLSTDAPDKKAIVAKANADLIKVTLSTYAPDKKADAIKTLLETGADPNIRLEIMRDNNPILQYFVSEGNPEAVEHLLKKGAKVNEKDDIGDTALHILAQASAPKIAVLKLLLDNKAELNKKNNEGKTPIDCANENGQGEIANAMRKHLDKAKLAIDPSSSPSSSPASPRLRLSSSENTSPSNGR